MSEPEKQQPTSSGRSIPVISETWFHDYIRSRAFFLRLIFAVSLVVLARFTNSSFLGWGLFASLAVLLVPIKRARSFIFAFVPYAGVWFVFTFLRSLADETTLAETINLKVFQLERWLFNGQIPTIMLQDRFYEPTPESPTATSLQQGESPYLGLRAFQRKDADLFFGRYHEIREAIAWLGATISGNHVTGVSSVR